jgi:hypothetical protein
MAKKIRWVLLFALIMLLASILWAQGNASSKASSGNAPPTAKRTATVVDSSGTETEVTDLEFAASDWRFDRHGERLTRIMLDGGRNDYYFFGWDPSHWIAIKTKTFEIAIRLDSLISIEANQKDVEAKYLWIGKEETARGALESGQFKGTSAFGKFELASGDLKQLKSNPAPTPVENRSRSPLDTTLVLSDGMTVRVGDLRRQYAWTHTEHRYFANEYTSTEYDFYDDFQFLRGKALATIGFDSLTSIEFGEKDDVTITTKDGKKATGTLTDINEIVNGNNHFAGITAFSGIGENGVLLIERKLVKAIHFDSNSGTRSK